MKGINLRVQIERNGFFEDVGVISGKNADDASFSYNENYVSDENAGRFL